VYFRRAMALEALGRQGDADPDWREIFRRRPEVVRQFPDAARRVLPTGQPSATPR
jgi:hypothetical protein